MHKERLIPNGTEVKLTKRHPDHQNVSGKLLIVDSDRNGLGTYYYLVPMEGKPKGINQLIAFTHQMKRS